MMMDWWWWVMTFSWFDFSDFILVVCERFCVSSLLIVVRFHNLRTIGYIHEVSWWFIDVDDDDWRWWWWWWCDDDDFLGFYGFSLVCVVDFMYLCFYTWFDWWWWWIDVDELWRWWIFWFHSRVCKRFLVSLLLLLIRLMMMVNCVTLMNSLVSLVLFSCVWELLCIFASSLDSIP